MQQLGETARRRRIKSVIARALFFGLLVIGECIFAQSLWAGDRYGAIAYSPTARRYGRSWGYETRAEAEAVALRYCPYSDAIIACWGKNSYIALAHGSGTLWGAAWGNDLEEAKRNALGYCRGNCHIVTTFYAGGEGRATVIANVPEGTSLFIGDNFEVKEENGKIEFVTPVLQGGVRRTYQVRAQLKAGDETFTEDKTVYVYGYETTYITFEHLNNVADLGGLPESASDVGTVPEKFGL